MSEIEKNENDSQFLDKRFIDELKTSYLLYSLSVIVSRAIPDVRDGLKPVQRRILYSMSELSLKHNSSFKKSARIVGEVMGKYHPHGDASIYDALVRMAQDFSVRYLLVDGQGNFGSIDRDPAAAMRYTEARMTEVSEYILKDIDKDTVLFADNFDGSLQQPTVLPSRIPNLLMNGASGIAVGMATSIPPHNLNELLEAFNALIDNPEINTRELMEFIKGPDLPTGGTIVDSENFFQMYDTGRGKFTIRSNYDIEDNDKIQAIVVKEIPYTVSKVDIIDQLVSYAVKLKEAKKDSGIKDIRDESDKDGTRLVIEVKRNANINKLLNDILKYTSLQTTFSVQMNVIKDNQPAFMNLKGLMKSFLEHRVDVITKRTNFELEKATKRAHIIDGLIKAVQGIDTVIDIIRESNGPEEALINLQETINVSAEQAKAISEMRLISLSKLEIGKLNDELKDLTEKIKWCNNILENKTALFELIKEELKEVGEKFGDKRRTIISKNESELKTAEEFIEDEDIVIVLTRYGYVKAISSNDYKSQGRGGKGSKGLKISDNDDIKDVILTNRLSKLMMITSAGKAFQLRAYEIELSEKSTKGKHIANYIAMSDGEEIKTIVPIALDGDYEKEIMIFTKNGKVKKTSLKEFENARKTGIRAINLKDEDTVVDAITISEEKEDVLLITKLGMALRFNNTDVRNMGRGATGVNSMKLRTKDEIVNAVKADENKKLIIISENGYGKRTNFKEFRLQNRGGIGIKCVKDIKKIGNIICGMAVSDDDDIIAFTQKGKAIRTPINSINILKRVTQGVITLRLDNDDLAIKAIVVKEKLDIKEEGEE